MGAVAARLLDMDRWDVGCMAGLARDRPCRGAGLSSGFSTADDRGGGGCDVDRCFRLGRGVEASTDAATVSRASGAAWTGAVLAAVDAGLAAVGAGAVAAAAVGAVGAAGLLAVAFDGLLATGAAVVGAGPETGAGAVDVAVAFAVMVAVAAAGTVAVAGVLVDAAGTTAAGAFVAPATNGAGAAVVLDVAVGTAVGLLTATNAEGLLEGATAATAAAGRGDTDLPPRDDICTGVALTSSRGVEVSVSDAGDGVDTADAADAAGLTRIGRDVAVVDAALAGGGVGITAGVTDGVNAISTSAGVCTGVSLGVRSAGDLVAALLLLGFTVLDGVLGAGVDDGAVDVVAGAPAVAVAATGTPAATGLVVGAVDAAVAAALPPLAGAGAAVGVEASVSERLDDFCRTRGFTAGDRTAPAAVDGAAVVTTACADGLPVVAGVATAAATAAAEPAAAPVRLVGGADVAVVGAGAAFTAARPRDGASAAGGFAVVGTAVLFAAVAGVAAAGAGAAAGALLFGEGAAGVGGIDFAAVFLVGDEPALTFAGTAGSVDGVDAEDDSAADIFASLRDDGAWGTPCAFTAAAVASASSTLAMAVSSVA